MPCFVEFSDTAGSHSILHFAARLGELVIFGEFPPAASVNIFQNIFSLLLSLAPVRELPMLFLLLMLQLNRTYFPNEKKKKKEGKGLSTHELDLHTKVEEKITLWHSLINFLLGEQM